MIKMFIDRPVLSAVVSILIVLLGILGLLSLPVTQYPDIAPPMVKISASYPGANAMTVLRSVIIPIEEQVNGTEGMTYINSTATNDGGASIEVYFEQGVNPDIAAVNVQNRLARATPLLPVEVTKSGIIAEKQQNNYLMFATYYSDNEEYDEVYLQNYLNINIIPAIQRVKGVSDVMTFGAKSYAMRIWLKPDKLAAYGLQPSDVATVINQQSQEAAPGQIGSNSGNSFEYVIRYVGKFNEEKQYEDIVIKALGEGKFLRLKDIADIQMDAFTYASIGENNGNPAVDFGVFQTPGSNAQEINKNVQSMLNEMAKELPEGVHYSLNFDTNLFLNASIKNVVITLIEAFILVFLVVFIFLQDLRSTLIPAIAVPVSIIGTFFFLQLFGYSVNLLTLFALVLAIGIVVDDAIVVVEAVHAKLENRKISPRSATLAAMGEISGAIISITLVMAAVFIPVTFIQGPTGLFYQQFGITLIIAILISAVNALTLSPMLCALFLKYHDHEGKGEKRNIVHRFFYVFNVGFQTTTQRYGQLIASLVRRKWIIVFAFVATLATLWWSNSAMPKGFVPNEDIGVLFGNVELPPGASMERTYATLRAIDAKVREVPGIETSSFVAGNSFFSGNGSNNGLLFMQLAPFDKRKGEDGQDVAGIIQALNQQVSSISEGSITFFEFPSVPGFGSNSGFEVMLLDKAGSDIADIDKVAQQFGQALMERPEIAYAFTSFNTQFPQYEMNIDVPRAEESGVSVDNILTTMQGYIGGLYAADFTKFGKQFRVMIQSKPESRMDIRSLNQLHVRTRSGAMAPISQFVTLQRVFGPQSVTRFNLFTSVKFIGAPAAGYSSGDAIHAIQQAAQEHLPADYSIDYSGLTREEIQAGSQTLFIFMLCLVFVYFILAAQYESFVLPLSVILSLPFGIMGAFLGQYLAGLENNIYFQIALIMLVGLLAKNAILIVEFALQRRRNGETLVQSAVNAAKARLRPILMTSFAFIFGMLPLVFASGIGALGSRSIGTGAAIGLLIGTILGVLAIPVLFVLFQWVQEKIKPVKQVNTTSYSIENSSKIDS